MFRAAVLLEEYRAVDPASVQCVEQAVQQAGRDLGFVTLAADAFQQATPISIDYAVMEKTARAAVVPVILRLVRCRLLACGVGAVGQGRARQCRAWPGSVRKFPQLQCRDRSDPGVRSKASMTSWWSQPRMRCWCRASRMPTA
ncbi:MAG: hypothetical protein MZV49_22220 [Rhodopseudomonas palustris]|nr:hypothetical protein [Rhodopseudomonas palustris]